MTLIKKIFINMGSFSWVLFIYLLHNEIFILDCNHMNITDDKYMNIIMYIIIFSLFSYISLILLKTFTPKNKESLTVEKIYPIYNELMPMYLAICVISFELNKYINFTESFSIIVISIFIFIIFIVSNIGYINPIWFFLGIRIYKIENERGNYIVILDKNETTKDIKKLDDLRKFDEYIFIKTKKEK